ncbi:diaminopimelate dehydrogenase [Candidatus Enterococcus ikei]|uniref:Meso-diaminopimelate D-dehydrogenase n=1 Tax=Candidatus Enterococcus ikei TaxID=2815326 RepID=A0ABS3GWL4_9ENTE|nr:diaminopimelate dehydrogenase [Enterococcus sp. DIV0869a]MBO0439647.1 diaminopimelate dehydrogenase [Enterococcus sp. DIV0869a]
MIKVAIIGYGNLGRGVERALKQNKDMELVGIFTRRSPELVQTEGGQAYKMEELTSKKNAIDVCILCGGSATDLPAQTPEWTHSFNTIDSFDTHAKIPEHFAKVDKVAKENKTTSIISTGWDPGLFSLNRLYAQSILPVGQTNTFWGKGVSQGHSDALRRIAGVADAVQYTIPNNDVIEKLKAGEQLDLTTRDKHFRECFVVLDEGADGEKIREIIVSMPNYFAEYDTEVHFISQAELDQEHKEMPHGGTVLHTGTTHENTKQVIEYNLQLESNPEFTASVLVAYARACVRLAREKQFGAFTVLDIAPKYLSDRTDEELRKELL